MQRLTDHKGVHIFIDYAHTPDALEKALQTLRPYVQNHLWVVFGCGGNRDSSKRPIMGNIAYQHADRCIVTDDNPRFEDPYAIRQQIIQGMTHSTEANHPLIMDIADRKAAISYALDYSQPGDIILVAGKGHEKGQMIGSTVFPFDDIAVTSELISQFQRT